MRLVKSLLVLWIVISPARVFSFPQTSLSELYKTGNVRFIQELVLDDDSMPGDLFFERPFAVVCDQDNNVYIVDSGANDIKKFDSDGNILVIVNTKDEVKKGKSFDAFNPEGHFISSVKIEGDMSFPLSPQTCFQNGSFWILKTGEDELYRAVKYRISD